MDRIVEKALNTIDKAFGSNMLLSNRSLVSFPIVYLNSFKAFDVKGDMDFIYIIQVSDSIPFELVRGMYSKCINAFHKRIVMYLDDARKKNKTLFSEARVNYLSSDGEIAFFEGEMIQDIPSIQDSVGGLSYTKSTQLVANFYLTNPIKEYTTREIASILGLSYSGVSRSNAFLFDIGALSKRGNHTGARYLLRSKKELLKKIEPFLIYPIKNRVMAMMDPSSINDLLGYHSGETALADYTDLEQVGSFIELAFSAKRYQELLKEKEDLFHGAQICYLEEFIYNPSSFSVSRTISRLDAYIIARERYKHSDDPRIRRAIASLEKDLIYGKKLSSGKGAR